MAAELTPTIAAHTVSALAAFAVGSWQLARKKGDFAHRSLGRVWFATATVAVLSSFFIFEIRPGRPSAIHLLSLATAFFMALSIFGLRRKNIAVHKKSMIGVYCGFVAAGAFSFTPGRLLPELLSRLFS